MCREEGKGGLSTPELVIYLQEYRRCKSWYSELSRCCIPTYQRPYNSISKSPLLGSDSEVSWLLIRAHGIAEAKPFHLP